MDNLFIAFFFLKTCILYVMHPYHKLPACSLPLSLYFVPINIIYKYIIDTTFRRLIEQRPTLQSHRYLTNKQLRNVSVIA